MFLQLGIERTLTPQPREGSLRFLAQLHLWQPDLLGRCAPSNADLHQLSSRSNPRIQAPRRHQFRLCPWIARKHSHDRDEILLRHLLRLPTHHTADEAARYPAPARYLTLVELPSLPLPLQCHTKIAHRFFLICVLHITQLLRQLQSRPQDYRTTGLRDHKTRNTQRETRNTFHFSFPSFP